MGRLGPMESGQDVATHWAIVAGDSPVQARVVVLPGEAAVRIRGVDVREHAHKHSDDAVPRGPKQGPVGDGAVARGYDTRLRDWDDGGASKRDATRSIQVCRSTTTTITTSPQALAPVDGRPTVSQHRPITKVPMDSISRKW